MDDLRALARILDDLVRIPGTRVRVGLDALLGLVPGIGDAAGGLVAAYALFVGVRIGAPRAVLARMGANILVDMALGAVPLLGDVADIGWKANKRNLRLLEAWSARPGEVRRRSTWLLSAVAIGLAAVILAAAAAVVWAAGALVGLVF